MLAGGGGGGGGGGAGGAGGAAFETGIGAGFFGVSCDLGLFLFDWLILYQKFKAVLQKK